VPPGEKDKRFADQAWDGNPGYFALRQAYLATRRLGEDLLAAGRGDPLTDQKAQLAMSFAFDALAPTNFLPTNPAALKKAFDTGGASVLAGARNFLDDLARNGSRPRQVDTSSFELSRNLAATPGRIVFRNDLMELIQYAPQTERVRAVPLLASPPWINKARMIRRRAAGSRPTGQIPPHRRDRAGRAKRCCRGTGWLALGRLALG
jgi:polyhydroxyalkanoate synthase